MTESFIAAGSRVPRSNFRGVVFDWQYSLPKREIRDGAERLAGTVIIYGQPDLESFFSFFRPVTVRASGDPSVGGTTYVDHWGPDPSGLINTTVLRLDTATGSFVPRPVTYRGILSSIARTQALPGGIHFADVEFTLIDFDQTLPFVGRSGGGGALSNRQGVSVGVDAVLSFESAESIWAPINPGGTSPYADGGPIEVGVKVRFAVPGTVAGVWIYLPSGTGGTHTPNVWQADGTLIGTGTFGDVHPGWNYGNVGSVDVLAGVTYIASVYCDDGTFSHTEDGLNTNVIVGDVTALGDGMVDGPNGVFNDSGPGFPDQSYNANNYWVDVSFIPAP